MKQGIHPQEHDITAHCAGCGSTYNTRSTLTELNVTLCSNCHPFYTNTQKFVDSAGRIEKFTKKYNKKK